MFSRQFSAYLVFFCFLLAFAGAPPAFPQEACDDFSRYANCPTKKGECDLGPAPAPGLEPARES